MDIKRLTIVAVAAALTTPAAAQAAQVGSNLQPANAPAMVQCASDMGGCTLSQRSAVVQQPGIVREWRVRSTDGVVKLVVIRANRVVAESAPQAVTTDTRQAFPASIAVQAGDRLGLSVEAGGHTGYAYSQGVQMDRWQPLLGAEARTPEYDSNDYELMLGATVQTESEPVVETRELVTQVEDVIGSLGRIARTSNSVRLNVSCPATAATDCDGRFTLRRYGRRIGAASFSLAPGASTKVRVRIARTAASLLRRAGNDVLNARITMDGQPAWDEDIAVRL